MPTPPFGLERTQSLWAGAKSGTGKGTPSLTGGLGQMEPRICLAPAGLRASSTTQQELALGGPG